MKKSLDEGLVKVDPLTKLEQVHEILLKDEQILWTGAPTAIKGNTYLEQGVHYDALSGGVSFPGILIALMVGGCVKAYYDEHWIAFILVLMIGIGLMILPEWVKRIRKKNTKYAITNQRLFFQLWWWWKYKLVSIPLDHIKKISIEEYKDQSGTLYFYTKDQPSFLTHDFKSGDARFCPTLEVISNALEVKQLITKQIKTINTQNKSL